MVCAALRSHLECLLLTQSTAILGDSAAAHVSQSMYSPSDFPAAGDDSPFIRPRSPSATPRKGSLPLLEPFRGDGSVRVSITRTSAVH